MNPISATSLGLTGSVWHLVVLEAAAAAEYPLAVASTNRTAKLEKVLHDAALWFAAILSHEP